jgi:2-polyprenyl-3-methyl-5-hydroxy-6-metoxy-1,4-benzoquinol methylase
MSPEEVAEAVEEIRRRVRQRHKRAADAQIEPPVQLSVTPLTVAREVVEARSSYIGRVNPRSGGLANAAIQKGKQAIARGLGWLVRGQVEFNQAVVSYMTENDRAMVEQNTTVYEATLKLAQEIADVRKAQIWLEELREAHTKMEMRTLQILRTVEASGRRRDELFQEERVAMHHDYQESLRAASTQIQERLWGDLDQLKVEHERQIHTELRTIRRKIAAADGATTTQSEGPVVTAAAPTRAPSIADSFDYASFEERFRGDEVYVSDSQEFYLPYFVDLSKVVDLGCGRGEFLAELASRGAVVFGVDLDTTALAACREKNIAVEQADIFEFLGSQADASWHGIMCAHVIEHLLPLRLQELTDLCYRKLRPGGVIAFETPNPGCLAIFAGDFYLDPTHQSPVPAGRMNFHLKESGFASIETHERHPAPEVFAELRALDDVPQTAAFRQKFFGGLDYAIIARKPAE